MFMARTLGSGFRDWVIGFRACSCRFRHVMVYIVDGWFYRKL